MGTADTIATWAEVVVRSLLADGHDPDPLLRAAGIEAARLGDANQRIPLQSMSRLWRAVALLTGDEGYGLRVAEHCRPADFHGLAFALQSSATLGEQLQRVVRFSAVISTSGALTLERGPQLSVLRYLSQPGLRVEQMATEALIACGLRFSRQARGDHRHSCVLLARPRPREPERWERAFASPVRFDQPCNAVEFPSRLLDLAEGGNSELSQSLDQAMAVYLQRLRRHDLPARVSEAIYQQLPHGEVQQRRIAMALGMSVRNLHRHLLRHGTCFTALLDDARRRLAFDYLRQSHLAVNEVGYRLGFLEPSSFNRAFRRWTGVSPGHWRRLQVRPGFAVVVEAHWRLAV